MGQSRIPAKCHHCACDGPQRGRNALEAGWVRARSGWVCALCAETNKPEPKPKNRTKLPGRLQTYMLLAAMGAVRRPPSR